MVLSASRDRSRRAPGCPTSLQRARRNAATEAGLDEECDRVAIPWAPATTRRGRGLPGRRIEAVGSTRRRRHPGSPAPWGSSPRQTPTDEGPARATSEPMTTRDHHPCLGGHDGISGVAGSPSGPARPRDPEGAGGDDPVDSERTERARVSSLAGRPIRVMMGGSVRDADDRG